MPASDDTLADLERQRLELEKNVRQLQQSLYHWRLWEAEYDALKEEISSLSDDSTKTDFLRTGRELGGSVVTEDEVKVLLGEGQGVSRTKEQVVQLISRRIDYVKQNVSTMERRLRAAEDKRDALLSGEQPVTVTETGEDFAMTEIVEELDEEGRVISSSTSTPGKEAPELLDMLKKAGVKDIAAKPSSATEVSDEEEKSTEKEKGKEEEVHNKESKISAEDDAEKSKTERVETVMQKEQKLVDQPKSSQMNGVPMENVQESEELQVPVTDIDESPEDAKLRREMLAYGLNEVGSVVAELELDEDGSDVSVEEDYDSYDYDSEEEEEDEYGRTTSKVLTEDYHKQMLELEKKLNARGMQNIGSDTSSLPEELRRDLETSMVVKVQQEQEPEEKKKKPKKKVAFADELDIAPEPEPKVDEKKTAPKAPEVNPIADSIVERKSTASESKPETKTSKKASRFKSARSSGAVLTPDAVPSTVLGADKASLPVRERPVSTPTPSLPLFPAKAQEKPFSKPIMSDIISDDTPRNEPRPPEGRTLADTLVERDTSRTNAAPPQPDELDEQLHMKEIATEFYKMSNRVIQQNGGFLDDEEPAIVPLDDAPGQPPTKKVSRFMAARMK
ncbi:conserved hypothetical protein [Paecilomyces variotii No. 5]|uniref:DUF3835 domain-containing protein n=1 Tax=Byssochlamys spectabilis (strain No. 5 / NBRC 109023) TaxID=1356009 RepID=V5I5E6_BYSSN|nr:conserved hypothetical protein [Paecilomyces variotii No. 5]